MNALDLRPSAATALIDARTDTRLSYRELLASAHALGEHIRAERSLLFVLARNDTFTARTYAASLLGHHAVALLDGDRTPADYVDLIEAYQPGWLAGPAGSAADLEAAGIVPCSVLDAGDGELVCLSTTPGPALHPELAVLLGTSGTTGSRRYVRLSYRNIAANAASIASCLELDASERPITSLPFHYSFGLSVVDSHWLVGATVVMSSGSVMERAFWEAAERHACSSLAGVPYTFRLLERIGYRDLQLPALRTMQQAGGPLDQRLTETYAEHMSGKGGRLFVMYGQTEATARMSVVPPERLLHKLGSAGLAIPGGRFRIDHSGADTPESGKGTEIGEVVYEGPNVMLGYATGAADLAAPDTLRGVLYTGDIGHLDDEGFLFLVGRSKRIAKVYGHRISLDELERALQPHGPAAAIAGDESVWVFCEFGTEVSLRDLRRELARTMRVHFRALRFRRVDAIPTSSSGKIDYERLRRWVPE